jgi:thiamine pyrophosphate-dependent acetolactate synthase large subunit-like protein
MADEIADAVEDALALNGPCVIEIPVAEHFPAAPHRPAPAGPDDGTEASTCQEKCAGS